MSGHRGVALVCSLALLAGASLAPPARASIDVTRYAFPGMRPTSLVAANDGNLWFGYYEDSAPGIGRITTAGRMTLFPAPPSLDACVPARTLVQAADGAFWSTCPGLAELARFDPSTATWSTVALAHATSNLPDGELSVSEQLIATDAHHDVWFGVGCCSLARYDVFAAPGSETVIGLPAGQHAPSDIAAGADGNVWFNDGRATDLAGADTIDRVATDGLGLTTFTTGADVLGIGRGPGAPIWFAQDSDRLDSPSMGNVDADGGVNTYALGASVMAEPDDIAEGFDGRVWTFSAFAGSELATYDPLTNSVSEDATAGYVPDAEGLTVGSDGNLWFGQYDSPQPGIVRLATADPLSRYLLLMDEGRIVGSRSALDHLGAVVHFLVQGAEARDIEDGGLGVVSTGQLPPGGTASATFFAAGTFKLRDVLAKGNAVKLAAPLGVKPASGTPATTFQLTWSTGLTAPSTEDVQVERPGSKWTALLTGTTASGAPFKPDAGGGTYAFRARLDNTKTQVPLRLVEGGQGQGPGSELSRRHTPLRQQPLARDERRRVAREVGRPEPDGHLRRQPRDAVQSPVQRRAAGPREERAQQRPPVGSGDPAEPRRQHHRGAAPAEQRDRRAQRVDDRLVGAGAQHQPPGLAGAARGAAASR